MYSPTMRVVKLIGENENSVMKSGHAGQAEFFGLRCYKDAARGLVPSPHTGVNGSRQRERGGSGGGDGADDSSLRYCSTSSRKRHMNSGIGRTS